jgi:NAD+ diphosphatase
MISGEKDKNKVLCKLIAVPIMPLRERDDTYMGTDRRYIAGYFPRGEKEKAWALAFSDRKLLVKETGKGFRLPVMEELGGRMDGAVCLYIGSYDGNECYAVQAGEAFEPGEGMVLADRRELTGLGGEGLFMLAGAASHLLYWYGLNRYCGRCGHETLDKADERAKICPACGNVIYPRISPATITAVLRGDEILLAHNRGFKGGIYSLIAGFVEPGENLEQCVAREIMEEVGVRVGRIRYFGSQPWPFPDSLMMAFIAEYESGEIRVDNLEISKAAWFRADSLPDIPGNDSIAGRIIRWFRDRYAP